MARRSPQGALPVLVHVRRTPPDSRTAVNRVVNRSGCCRRRIEAGLPSHGRVWIGHPGGLIAGRWHPSIELEPHRGSACCPL